MRIIISPAKKMNTDTDSLPYLELPRFIDRTERLLEVLRAMDAESLKKLWKCNDRIAVLNIERLARMDLRQGLTPALLAYEGIQYQHIKPAAFTRQDFDYAQEHLRILSGFYGLLRPFDGVAPYRLEMQAKLSVDGAKDLYSFWGDAPARQLFAESDCIFNLASREYSLCVSKYLSPATRFITCTFGEEQNGKVIEKGTMCKMARGEMLRHIVRNGITNPEEAKSFDLLGYRFDNTLSDSSHYVFLR